jgi:hypothetical protein
MRFQPLRHATAQFHSLRLAISAENDSGFLQHQRALQHGEFHRDIGERLLGKGSHATAIRPADEGILAEAWCTIFRIERIRIQRPHLRDIEQRAEVELQLMLRLLLRRGQRHEAQCRQP